MKLYLFLVTLLVSNLSFASNIIYDSGDTLEKVRCGSTYCPIVSTSQKQAELERTGFINVVCVYHSDFGNTYGLRCSGTLKKPESEASSVCRVLTEKLVKAVRAGEMDKVNVLAELLAENNCETQL